MKHKVLQTTVYIRLRNAFRPALDRVIALGRFSQTLLFGSALGIAIGVCWVPDAIAQQVSPELRDAFLSDPLESEPLDPLLPVLPVEREYSPLEKQAIAADLDKLNQAAQELLQQEQLNAAFGLWRRELKLRRVIGTTEEFEAIQRVAAIAWAQQRQPDVQLLTLRTREIWEAIKTSLGTEEETMLGGPDTGVPQDSLISGAPTADIAILTELGQTFTVLRDIDSAVEVYQQLIVLAADRPAEKAVQQLTLAELHLEWFQFAEATNTYLALLETARASSDQAAEIAYLERLAYTYQQAKSLPNAVRAQTDLLEIYQGLGRADEFPELMVAIAQNYRTLNLHTSAIDYYRAAYRAAQRFEQFSFSAQALKDLGSLYESLALTDEALGAYTLLVPVEEQAYNDYGVMNAYDNIGQLQRRKGNPLEALKAFEKALVIANRLGLSKEYFIEQIESVT
ncbi:MAG: hypothetical protein AAFY54_10990 [Cyanobacteria bacterium J06648_10]